VATWREILPAMAEMIDLQHSATIIFGLTMYIGAAMLIMNSMLMMVFERIREFGVMKAIGLKGWKLMVLVYFETFWMCVLGAAIGTLVGAPLVLWVGHTGIDLSMFAPDGFAVSGTVLDPVMYADLTPTSVAVPVLSLFVIAFLSVLYPAVKAAVIEPVKALTHV
jgi:ABC-type antimicrobial peptide transport system permease subunit